MSQALAEQDQYLSDFERFEERGAAPAWVQSIRREAISRFAALGFPTTKDEEWKYTSVAPIFKIPFKPATAQGNGVNTVEALDRTVPISLPAERLAFIDGHYSKELSSRPRHSERVTVSSLAGALASDPEALRPHLARYADFKTSAFVALNTAFLEDGAFVYIPRGAIIEEPIFILFISTAGGETEVSYPRNLIVADRDSQVTLVEAYLGPENRVYFTSGVTEIVAGENAVVDHYKLLLEGGEAFHVATQQAQLERNSNFTSHLITLGGSLVRNDVNAVLAGEGVECVLNGLFLATGKQHVDSHTRIDHVKPHGMSRELYKGILDGKAKGVFNGKIYVHKSAPKTDAKQTNKNLLLSQDAAIDTKPQLEIYNNDVNCTHGSTIGQISQDALFYLRARGLGPDEARKLLTYAFASEIIRGIKVASVREQMDDLLIARLGDKIGAKERLL